MINVTYLLNDEFHHSYAHPWLFDVPVDNVHTVEKMAVVILQFLHGLLSVVELLHVPRKVKDTELRVHTITLSKNGRMRSSRLEDGVVEDGAQLHNERVSS